MGTHHQQVQVRDTNRQDVFDYEKNKIRGKGFKKFADCLSSPVAPPYPINQGKYLQPSSLRCVSTFPECWMLVLTSIYGKYCAQIYNMLSRYTGFYALYFFTGCGCVVCLREAQRSAKFHVC